MIGIDTNNAPLLEMCELSFSWTRNAAPLFGPLNMSAEKGKIITLLGSNGTGKTTLLKVIAHRLSPSTGHVKVARRPSEINDFNYMIQDSARLLFPHLSLNQNLALRKSSKQESTSELTHLLFPDSQVLSRYPSQCSGGQRQRAVLCRAIEDMAAFPVTLLDEPFAQVSQDVKARVYSVARKIVQEADRVALVVTHDIPEALILGDSVAVLSSSVLHIFDASGVVDNASFLEAVELRDKVRRATISTCGSTSPNV
jgi:ABC-type nitrate/sulfonate/bicarbonate transport system ATPase subunit